MIKPIQLSKLYFLILTAVIFTLIYRGGGYINDKQISANQKKEIVVPEKFSYLNERMVLLENPLVPVDYNTSGIARNVPVLLYHGITENGGNETVSWNDFRKQMYLLKANGYETIGLESLYEYLVNNEPVPPKSFVLTFDDGRKDSFYPVDPILKALNYKAAIFVIGIHINEESSFYLNKDELIYMTSTGRWEIHSHSYKGHQYIPTSPIETGYFLSNKMWLESENRYESEREYEVRIAVDLFRSRDTLETELGTNSFAIAFPYGDYGQKKTNYYDSSRQILKNAKETYGLAFYQAASNEKPTNYTGRDNFLVKRITIKEDWDAPKLIQTLDNL